MPEILLQMMQGDSFPSGWLPFKIHEKYLEINPEVPVYIFHPGRVMGQNR